MSKYEASSPGEWRHPNDDPPPRGSKIVMLTRTGIQIIGLWQVGCVAWMPLVKVHPELKRRLYDEGNLI